MSETPERGSPQHQQQSAVPPPEKGVPVEPPGNETLQYPSTIPEQPSEPVEQRPNVFLPFRPRRQTSSAAQLRVNDTQLGPAKKPRHFIVQCGFAPRALNPPSVHIKPPDRESEPYRAPFTTNSPSSLDPLVTTLEGQHPALEQAWSERILQLEGQERRRGPNHRVSGNNFDSTLSSFQNEAEHATSSSMMSHTLSESQEWDIILSENPQFRGRPRNEWSELSNDKFIEWGYQHAQTLTNSIQLLDATQSCAATDDSGKARSDTADSHVTAILADQTRTQPINVPEAPRKDRTG